MPCNCDSRLDSIMKFLEDLKTEMGFVKEEIRNVKTKCIQIEKEILGITAESEVKAEDLMETTTVRHLVEKIVFDVNKLTEEIKTKANAEAKRQQELESAIKDLHSKFTEATVKEIKELKGKYDVITSKTFRTEFSKFLEEFHSQTEKVLLKRGFSSSTIHDMVKEIAGTVDLDNLYKTNFSSNWEWIGSNIRGQYRQVIWAYTLKANERMEDFPEIGLDVIAEFLNKFNLCEESFATFQKELFKEFQQVNKKVIANLKLLERLTEDYRQYFTRIRHGNKIDAKVSPRTMESELENVLSYRLPFPVGHLYAQKLRQNIEEISLSN